MNTRSSLRRTAGALASLAVLALCAPVSAETTRDDGLTVERVVMLMRHGVRPSTKFPATPAGTTKEPWPAWSTPAGLLTPHGADGIRRLAEYDRIVLAEQGILPATGCAQPGTVTAWASGSSRAIETGKAFLGTLQPGCSVALGHPEDEDAEDQFHPDPVKLGLEGNRALASAQKLLPKGGLGEVVRQRSSDFARLQRIVGVPIERESKLKATAEGEADMKGGLSFGSTAGQTLLLQYLEGMPMDKVGWGRTSKADIQAVLRFHPIKFQYEARPPYIAQREAAPLVTRIVDALGGKGGRLTMLFGHDGNVAALGGFYDLHWTMADYPRDDIAPGGAIGFELVRDRAGKPFVRVFQQSQFMDQVRNLTPLTKAAPPSRSYLTIPGCGTGKMLCDLATFEALTRQRLAHPAE